MKSVDSEFFREVFHRSPNGMLIVEKSGRCVDANAAAERLLGLSRQQLLSKKVTALLSQNQKGKHRHGRNAVPASTGKEIEFRYVRPGGSALEIGALTSGSIRRDKRLIILHDITSRKHAEDAVRKQTEILDFANDTIMIRDLNDVITYWNRGAERLYGWNREEALGKYVHSFLNTIFPAPMKEVLNQCIREGHWEGVLIHKKRDGTPVTVASRWTVERDEHGRPTAYLEINNDITERTKAEEGLRKAHSELERRVIDRTRDLSIANERLKALSARLISAQEEERWRISRELHDDLGQILTSISLNLQRALKADARKKGDLLAQVLATNQEARNRLRQLSSLLRPRVLDDVGLKEAIQTYVSEFENETGVRSSFVCRCHNAEFTADACTNLYRITQEALTNVSKHAHAKNVTVRLYRERRNVVLRIKDDGVGFSIAAISMERTLGLQGMRERAELLGGELRLSAIPGHGAEIMVRFPRKPAGPRGIAAGN